MSESGQRLTRLPVQPAPPAAADKPNPARSVQEFVGGAMAVVSAPIDALNLGMAKATLAFVQMLPKFPAARLFGDIVFGWPHAHSHPPNLIPPAPPIPLPSFGPAICAGAVSVLINGLPAARCGDLGFGVWCGGFFPIFEVQTGSSHVFIGGARPARMLIDFTRHCMPGEGGFSKLGAAMAAFSAGMGALGVASSLIDKGYAEEEAEEAPTEEEAMAASAQAAAMGVGAAVGAMQTAADLAAAALGMMIGKDPAIPPGIPLGNFITGSPNVLIGGFPMPGWMAILRGLGKLLKGVARRLPRKKQNGGCGIAFEPIDIVTGANVDEFIDFMLPAPRFVWRRWYNSQHQRRGVLGWGFSHEYERSLSYDESTSQYTYIDQEGNETPFPPFLTDIPGERVILHGYVLTRLSERRYELATHNQATLEFEFREITEPARLIALRDWDGNFGFEYDDQARLILIRIDKERTIRLTYYPAGMLSEVTLEQPGREPVYVARYRYDAEGRLIGFRDALDHTASYQYDKAHRMTRKTDRRGYSYSYRYDEQGRCVRTGGEDGLYQGSLEYYTESNMTLVKYSDGGVWTYDYNDLGTITKITDPYGGAQHRIVDMQTGQVLREVYPAGDVTRLVFDKNGAHTERLDHFGYSTPPLDIEPHPDDPLDRNLPETPLEWEFGDMLDKDMIGVVSPNDPWLHAFPELAADIAQSQPPIDEQEEFDLLGRLIERRNSDGSSERWEYDAEGNEILYVNGDGSRHRKEYISWNLLHREIDPLGAARTFQYSPTEEITSFVDPGGAIHQFTYDLKDRLVEVRRDGMVRDYYRYDEADNLVEKLDGQGRSILVCEPGPGGLDLVRRFAGGEVYRFEYNLRGQHTKALTSRDTVICDYNEDEKLIKDERNGLGVAHEFADDQLLSTIIFGKFRINYEKQRGGRLKITDPTGRAHKIHYGKNGLILKELTSGTEELIQYDDQGRCLRKIAVSAAGGRRGKKYSYSATGDLLRVADSERGAVNYRHDETHRLKEEIDDYGRRQQYVHDAAGNLLSQPGLTGVTIGPGNQILAAGGERFTYDKRGNVHLRESAQKTTRYEYDSDDQLIGCWINGQEWRADYDALGRRTRKQWLGQITEYYWDDDRLAAEIRSDQSVRVYIYSDPRALTPFLYVDYASLDQEPESGRVRYLFTNHLGTPDRVEDDSGNMVWQGALSPYGKIKVEFGRYDEINLRFPGHYYDPETGLHYNRFRYYDPVLGCYIQCDPLGIAGGYNLYAAPHNPLNDIDILGLHGKLPGRTKGKTGKGKAKTKGNAKSRAKQPSRRKQKPQRLAERRAREIRDNPNLKRKPRVVTVVRDKRTGKIYYGESGWPQLEHADAHSNLGMPLVSQEDWKPGNCGEPKAINAALNDGARKSDLQVASIYVPTGEPIECCKNCKHTTRGTTVLTDPIK